MSDFNFLHVEYDGVDFGNIGSGKDTVKTVRATTMLIRFHNYRLFAYSHLFPRSTQTTLLLLHANSGSGLPFFDIAFRAV